MGEVKNIVFDMGGVLTGIDREACVREFRRIGFPQAAGMIDNYRQTGIFADIEDGRVTAAELYDHIRSHSSGDPTDAEIEYAFTRIVTPIPAYKLDMLLDLRRDFRVFMLSNTNPILKEYIAANFFTIRGLTMDDYFDRLFLSYEMGMMKPDRAIFERMAAEAGMDPRRTLFIDDGQQNVEMAASLGFRTYRPVPDEDFRGIF